MSRRLLGGWGWDLSDREFGRALALLGVIAPALRAGEQDPSSRAPLTRTQATNLLAAARATAGDGPLVWDPGSADAARLLGERLDGVPAGVLTGIWETGFAGYHPLEIRPARGFDDRWAFEILSHAVEHQLPFFALAEPPGRLRWHWPTRVGFRADDAAFGDWLFERLSPTMAGLTEREDEPIRCDMLVMQTQPMRRFAAIASTPLPEATFVIVLETDWKPEPLLRARAIARRAGARGVAVVSLDFSGSRPTEWFRSFLRELSHESALLTALKEAGHVTGLIATPELAQAVPLRLAGEALTARMVRTTAMTAARPPQAPALPERTRSALIVPPGTELSLPELGTQLQHSNLAFSSEGGDATDVAIVSRAVEPVLRELEGHEAEDRYIRAGIGVIREREDRTVSRGFLAGARHRVSVSIGPSERGLVVGMEAIPREVLADAAGHRLTVVLTEPDLLRKPLVGSFELPAFGPSEAAVFELPVRRTTTAVRARIAILHRGRILQTALLRGPAYSEDELARHEADGLDDAADGIAIVPEAVLRPGLTGLDDRTRFQAAVILNHDDAGRTQGSAIGRRKVAHLGLDLARDALAGLSAILEEAERDKAFERKLDSAASVRYLTKLAIRGSSLYIRIGKAIEATHGAKIERLQVLSANPNTLLPVELIYDLPPPANRPRLCDNAQGALKTGQCQPGFHPRNILGQSEVVCPSGFWGVTKIIERYATDPKKTGTGFTVWAGAGRGGNLLGPLTPLLFAASDHVNDVNKTELRDLATTLDELTGKQVVTVTSWTDWATEVEKGPPVLVLLSHTATDAPLGASLEIAAAGGPEQVATGQITEAFVNPSGRKPGPLVLLLGCTTGVPLDDVQSFVVQFADRGAPVVIGTIAPVLGRHAGRTAGELIRQIRAVQVAAGRREGVPMGEVLRDVRRALLGRGILMAMSLAAYGDADWRLPAGGN